MHLKYFVLVGIMPAPTTVLHAVYAEARGIGWSREVKAMQIHDASRQSGRIIPRSGFRLLLIAILIFASAFALFVLVSGERNAHDDPASDGSTSALKKTTDQSISPPAYDEELGVSASSPARSGTSVLYSPRTPFSPLAVSPERFAYSTDNPFACTKTSEKRCNWGSDPLIARSPAEARWMLAQGFPTTAQRQSVVGRPIDVVLREAKAKGDTALEALALESEGLTVSSVAGVHSAVLNLESLAERTGTLYGLVAAARLAAHGYQLARISGAEPSASSMAFEMRETAVDLALEATLLGDPLTLDSVRHELGALNSQISLTGVVVTSRNLWRSVRDNESTSISSVGRSWGSIPPRPVPYREIAFGEDGEEIESWYGEP